MLYLLYLVEYFINMQVRMDTDGTVSEVKVAHTGDPEVGYKFIYITYKKFQTIVISDKNVYKNKTVSL